MPILQAESLSKSFSEAGGQAPVLDEVSLTVSAGEMVTIVGPSGSGKSTLLYCLAGLEKPTRGAVRVASTDLWSLSRREAAAFRRDNLGFVFQAYNLVPYLSAFENAALPLRLSRRRFRRQTVDDALSAVGLAEVGAKLPAQLSGGQQQRVAVARALVSAPTVLFADEPTGALDSANGAGVLTLLRRFTDQGGAVIMVTHDLEAAAIGDRSLVLRDGRIHAELAQPTASALFRAVEAARA